MTEHDSLLRAVLLDLRDDTPRLVYADKLDELAGRVPCGACKGSKTIWTTLNKVTEGEWAGWGWRRPTDCPTCSGTGEVSDGRGERAEFIRVQCELATSGPCPATLHHPVFDRPNYGGKLYVVPPPQKAKEPCGWCSVCKAKGRESALLDAYTALWFPFPGVAPTWRRGFVGAVESSLATLFGGPCLSCDGVGDDGGRAERYEVCPRCSGTGAVAGCAEGIFQSQPVTAVRLTDREPFPYAGGGSYDWWPEDPPGGLDQHPASDIGRELFEVMKRLFPGSNFGDHCRFTTRDLADTALSRTAVEHGRHLAGLPELVPA